MNPNNRIDGFRIPPVERKGSLSNGINKYKDSNDLNGEAFEEILKRAMENGPTNTNNIGMDQGTMDAILAVGEVSSTVKNEITPKEQKKERITSDSSYDDIARAIVASQTQPVRILPKKNPYDKK